MKTKNHVVVQSGEAVFFISMKKNEKMKIISIDVNFVLSETDSETDSESESEAIINTKKGTNIGCKLGQPEKLAQT